MLSFVYRLGNGINSNSVILKNVRRGLKTSGCTLRSTIAVENENSTFRTAEEVPQLDSDFCDHENSFRTKTTWEIARALMVLRLCSFEKIVDNSIRIFNIGQKLLGARLFNAILKPTFYSQFVAGDNPADIKAYVSRMQLGGVGPLLAVSIEEDVTDQGYRSSLYDNNLTSFIDCINLAAELDKRSPMIQLKVTALMPAKLMVTLGEMFKEPVNLMDMTEKSLSLQNMCEEEQLQLLEGIERLKAVGELAAEKGVRVMVDAEYTYLNPGISVVALAMMMKWNKVKPLIWNTYQCYLKATYNDILRDYNAIRNQGLCFGAKIVRGAYITAEAKYARSKGLPNPVHDSYQDTCDSYNRVVAAMLEHIPKDKEKLNFIIATHNEDSVRLAVKRMSELGIPQDGSVFFGQLLGMCDQVSYALGHAGYQSYKSLPYGTVEETLPYLSRRAQENRSVVQAVRKERDLLWKEYKCRLSGERKQKPK